MVHNLLQIHRGMKNIFHDFSSAKTAKRSLFFLELMLLLLAASQFPINFPSCQLILPSFQCSLFFSFRQVFLKVFKFPIVFSLRKNDVRFY